MLLCSNYCAAVDSENMRIALTPMKPHQGIYGSTLISGHEKEQGLLEKEAVVSTSE